MPTTKGSKSPYPPTLKRLGNKNPIAAGWPIHHLQDRESLRQYGSVEFSVRIIHIPSAVEQLKLKGKDASWIVFMFDTPIVSADTDDRALNLQYSFKERVLGLGNL